MGELEFDDVEIGKFYYSKEEQAYFYFLFYNSWSSCLISIVVNEFAVKQIFSITKEMWYQMFRGNRDFVFSQLKEENNYKIPRVILSAVLKEITMGQKICDAVGENNATN
jgi:hypothetical protein